MNLSIFRFSFHRKGNYYRARVFRGKQCYGWVEMPDGTIAEWNNILDAVKYLAYAYTGKDYLVQ